MKSKLGWQRLIQIIQDAKGDDKQIDQILSFLLTDEEKAQLAKRVLLTNYLLFSDKTQRSIANELEISLTTITRCSNLLKRTSKNVKEKFKFNVEKKK